MELPSSLASLKPQPGPSRLRVSGSEASRQTLATLHSAAEAIAEEILTPSPVNQHDARYFLTVVLAFSRHDSCKSKVQHH